jgi:hypothetical protein
MLLDARQGDIEVLGQLIFVNRMAKHGFALFSALLVLGVSTAACHKNAHVQSKPDVRSVVKDTARVVKDTARVLARITDTSVIALFRDTGVVNVFSAEGQTFKLQTPAQRRAFRATLRREHELWQARKPRDYKFLLRVACFCPGTRGWLLIEIRDGQPLRAWDKTGKSAALTDWNTLSIDGLYENLERSADHVGSAQIAFDPRWHFPKYVHTVVLPGPDAWSTIEVRGFRPT